MAFNSSLSRTSLRTRARYALTLATVLGLSLLEAGAAATYYVDDAGGSDRNDGISAPWKTIQKAFNSAPPGSTVYIRAGIYKERLVLNVSGSQGAGFTTFASYQSDTVILDGTGITASPLIDITNKRYVRIQGIRIRNYIHDSGRALGISGGSDHIEIRRNKFTNIKIASGTTSSVIKRNLHVWNLPIRVSGNDPVRPNDRIIIDGNEISDCEEGWGETLTVAGNSTNWEITNNRIFDCQKGIDAAGHFNDSSDPATDQARNGVIRGNEIRNIGLGVGVYVDGARDVVIERNTISGIRESWGIVVSCERAGKNASGIIVRNNVVYDNLGGISVGGWIPTYGRVVDSQIFNNTVVNNKTGLSLTLASRIAFMHNIVVGSATALTNLPGNEDNNYFNYNLYHPTSGFVANWRASRYRSLEAFREATGQDTHSLTVDPSFQDAAAFNFHLTATSPAADRGDPSFVPAHSELDIDGEMRVARGRVDMGADEIVPPKPATPANFRVLR